MRCRCLLSIYAPIAARWSIRAQTQVAAIYKVTLKIVQSAAGLTKLKPSSGHWKMPSRFTRTQRSESDNGRVPDSSIPASARLLTHNGPGTRGWMRLPRPRFRTLSEPSLEAYVSPTHSQVRHSRNRIVSVSYLHSQRCFRPCELPELSFSLELSCG